MIICFLFELFPYVQNNSLTPNWKRFERTKISTPRLTIWQNKWVIESIHIANSDGCNTKHSCMTRQQHLLHTSYTMIRSEALLHLNSNTNKCHTSTDHMQCIHTAIVEPYVQISYVTIRLLIDMSIYMLALFV